ncbi:MAG: ABC transporter substrate-binding protein, partial [Gammaproteobacteria bacterium]
MSRYLLPLMAGLMLASPLALADEPKRGGEVTVLYKDDFDSMDPAIGYTVQSWSPIKAVFDGLMDYKPGTSELVPDLAEGYEISSDGKTYTFKLRKGVKFHNGKEMTAADVKWSVMYAMDPKNGATGVVPLRSVGSVNAKDKYTIEIVMKEVDSAFLATLGSIRPFPVVPEGSITDARIQSMPPGTGPFAFKDYKPDREIVFVRHPDYWQKGLPYLDELVLRPIRDETVRFTSVRAGDVDMIERTAYGSVRGVVKGEYPDLRALPAKYAGFRRLLFNVVDPPFNNIKVRQAVRYALDKQQFIEGAFWGLGEPADQLVPKESPWFIKLPETKRDLEKV